MHLPRPGDGGDFTPVPGGQWPAICYRVIDMGTQDETYQGEAKRMHKVLLAFELKDDDCRMPDGRPMVIGQKYTWSMGDKAKLRKHLESWRTKAFVESDFGPEGFNIANLLGVACSLTVTQKTSRNGRTYSEITGIGPLHKDMKAKLGPLINEKVYVALDPDLFDGEAFGKLSERLRNQIMSSPQYHDLANGKSAEKRDEFGGMDDEVPF